MKNKNPFRQQRKVWSTKILGEFEQVLGLRQPTSR